jgi:zinc protease
MLHLSGGHAGLAPTRTALDNGAVIVARETRKTPIVSINIAVRAGTICDPADAPGAMNLLARVIDRGTERRSASVIAEELDNRGISLSIGATRHLFSMVCTCLAEDFEAVLSLLGEILIAPAVPEAELAKRKGEAVTAIRQDEDNPGVRAVETLMAALYGADHPYGRRAKGTVASVEAITRSRLLDLHASRFAPSELTAVIVGDVETARVVDAGGRVFGAWHKPAPPPIPLEHAAPARSRRRIVVPMMNKAQADIAYGFVTIPRSDPSFYAFWLMNNALGQYALGGRLGDSIRERQGMAYYVSSALDASLLEGPLLVRAGVGPANVDRAVASIDAELVRLRAEGLTPKELNESRQYLIGSMPRALETNAGIAQFLQTAEFFGLGLDYDLRLPTLLGAVTLDDVHRTAAMLDPDTAAVVIAGPYQ